jgi:hypothetical protein
MVVWLLPTKIVLSRKLMNGVMEEDHVENTSSVSHTGSTKDAALNYSCSIPLPSSHISRTESEMQLAVDIAAAEKRDERMFHRLITGIQVRHQKQASSNKPSFRTSRIAPASSESQEASETNSRAVDSAAPTSRYCPVTAIAKIVDTRHARLHDSQDRILNSGLQPSDDEDEDHVTLPLTEMQRMFQLSRASRTSESTLSDNDWSISGFSSSHDPNQDCLGDHRPKDVTEAPSAGLEDDDDEEIFILDL